MGLEASILRIADNEFYSAGSCIRISCVTGKGVLLDNSNYLTQYGYQTTLMRGSGLKVGDCFCLPTGNSSAMEVREVCCTLGNDCLCLTSAVTNNKSNVSIGERIHSVLLVCDAHLSPAGQSNVDYFTIPSACLVGNSTTAVDISAERLCFQWGHPWHTCDVICYHRQLHSPM